MCECGFLGTSSTILYLCISLETGPRCPNPDAMLLISTCFQEQYGVCLAHWFSVCGQRDSSIMSERSIPSDIGYATQHILHDIWTPTVSMNMSVIQTLPHMQKRFSNSNFFLSLFNRLCLCQDHMNITGVWLVFFTKIILIYQGIKSLIQRSRAIDSPFGCYFC